MKVETDIIASISESGKEELTILKMIKIKIDICNILIIECTLFFHKTFQIC